MEQEQFEDSNTNEGLASETTETDPKVTEATTKLSETQNVNTESELTSLEGQKLNSEVEKSSNKTDTTSTNGSIITTAESENESIAKGTAGHAHVTIAVQESMTSDQMSTMDGETRNSQAVPSAIKVPPKNPLEDFSDEALVSAVEELKKNAKYLELENSIFLHFLQKNDPSLLESMEPTLHRAEARIRRSCFSGKRLTLSRFSKRESAIMWNPSSLSAIISDIPVIPEKEGPKININQKMDLTVREMDNLQTAARKFQNKYFLERHKLQAQLEEMSNRESELKDTYALFDNVFIKCTVEKYLQNKNPAEKFCRFMEEWFKNSRLAIDKIRLRTSSLKVQYQKICNQLVQKQLIGKNLQEVDFEQLYIENKHMRDKIEQRHLLLIELKKINGKANLLLSQIKKQLLKKTKYLSEIQEGLAFREDRILKFDNECNKVAMELDAIKNEFDKIKQKTETYQVPDILDYVRTKAEQQIAKKNLNIWMRRRQLKEMSLLSSISEMKHITGMSSASASWFKDPGVTYNGTGSMETNFEFQFERRKRLMPKTSRYKKSIRSLH